MQRQCKREERELALYFPSAACLIQRQCKVSAAARRENFVLPDLILPNRSLPYTKTMQTRGKRACSLFPECSLPYAKAMQTRGKRACSYFPECSLPYTKIRKMVCNVNTITLFFSNQEYIKKHKITVLNVKLSLLQTENYAVEIRKTESESKNGSIRHIAQYPVTQRIIQNNLPTTLFPVHDKGFSAKPKRLFRHAGKTLRHPQTHFPAAPKSPFDRNKAR